MKISAVQFCPTSGNIASNIAKHLAYIELAIGQGADLIFFPELSLTGYEPHLAKSLASNQSDPRLDIFQQRSDSHNLMIGVGLPILTGDQVQIGMIWFTPNVPRQTYAKQQLHADEIPFLFRVINNFCSERLPILLLQQSAMNHFSKATPIGQQS